MVWLVIMGTLLPYFAKVSSWHVSRCILVIHDTIIIGCQIRYYHNYYFHVLQQTRHFYVSQIPQFIEIGDHTFVESDLCELFTLLMLFAWVSHQNCSNIINTAITKSQSHSFAGALSSEDVFRAFTMNALLREAAEDGVCLILPGIGDNNERLKQAIELRNRKMIICGQKERMHACNKCEKLLPGTGVNNSRKWNSSFSDIKDFYSQCYSFSF